MNQYWPDAPSIHACLIGAGCAVSVERPASACLVLGVNSRQTLPRHWTPEGQWGAYELDKHWILSCQSSRWFLRWTQSEYRWLKLIRSLHIFCSRWMETSHSGSYDWKWKKKADYKAFVTGYDFSFSSYSIKRQPVYTSFNYCTEEYRFVFSLRVFRE